MTSDDPLLRFNGRVEPVHLAFLLDMDRNATGIIRALLDEKIQDSEYDYDELKQAASAVAQASDHPRAPFKKMNRTEEILERASVLEDGSSMEADGDTEQGVKS